MSKQETILFVEDDRIGMQPLVDILEASDYHVLWAHDATSALHMLRDHRGEIDVIVLDVMMPLGNEIVHPEGGRWAGVALLRKLREDGEIDNIPVVGLTIVTDREILRELDMLGVKYLQKDESISEILKVIRQTILVSELNRRLHK